MCANNLHKQQLFIFRLVQGVETQFGMVIIANAQVAKDSTLSCFTPFAMITIPNCFSTPWKRRKMNGCLCKLFAHIRGTFELALAKVFLPQNLIFYTDFFTLFLVKNNHKEHINTRKYLLFLGYTLFKETEWEKFKKIPPPAVGALPQLLYVP